MKLHQLREEERHKKNMRDVLGGGKFSYSIYLHSNGLESLLHSPEQVSGDFSCGLNKLTSLEYAPTVVGGSFSCVDNKLTSLEHAPLKVGGFFDCSINNLTSLEHAPTLVGGAFRCGNNMLTSLEHAPLKVGGEFHCSRNKLTSLEHAPAEVGGEFHCSRNKLKSLKGIHKQIKKMNGRFVALNNYELNNNLLGLILIPGITEILIDNKDIANILDKYLNQPNKKLAMLQCQQELIDAGFEEAAQL